jgi:hypothetical protein
VAQPSDQNDQISVTEKEIRISPKTVLKLKMLSRLSSATAHSGDKFEAELAQDLVVNNLPVLPAGCKVIGHVTSATAAQRGRAGAIGITFDRLILPSGRAIDVVGELTSVNANQRRQIDREGRMEGSLHRRNAVFIGGGIATGAAIGAIAGGARGAGIGAAVGLGAGLLGALIAPGNDAVVLPGQQFGLLLTEPLRIPNAGLSIASNAGGNAEVKP